MAQWGRDSCQTPSDTDIETINCEELVIFETTRTFYTNKNDIAVQYSSGSAVDPTPRDWIGLFQSGWQTPQDVSVYQWVTADPPDQWQFRKHRAIFPQNDVKELSGDFQFLYVTNESHVIGVSEIFQIIEEDLVASIHDKLPVSLSLISLETASSSSGENQASETAKSSDGKKSHSEHEMCKSPEPDSKARSCSPVQDNWSLSDFVVGVRPDVFLSRLRFAKNAKESVDEYEPLKNFHTALRHNPAKKVEEVDPECNSFVYADTTYSPCGCTQAYLNTGSELNLRGCAKRVRTHAHQHHPYLHYRPSLVLSVSRDNFRRSCLEAYRKTFSDCQLGQQLNALQVNPLLSRVNDVEKWSNTLLADKPSQSSEFDCLSDESLIVKRDSSATCESTDDEDAHAKDSRQKQQSSKQLLPIFRKRAPVENDESNSIPVAIPTTPIKWNFPGFDKPPVSPLFKPTVPKVTKLPIFDVDREVPPDKPNKETGETNGLSNAQRGTPGLMLADTLTNLVSSNSSVTRLGDLVPGSSSSSGVTLKTASTIFSVSKTRVVRPRKRLGQTISSYGIPAKRRRLSGKKGAATTLKPNPSAEEKLFAASQETINVLDLALTEALKENSELRQKVASLESQAAKRKSRKPSPASSAGKSSKKEKTSKATNTAVAPIKKDSSSQCVTTQVVGKGTNTAAAPIKKDSSSQCVKAQVVGKATNTATPVKKDSSSQCAKKKLVGKGTNTAAAPAKKDAENNTITVPKVESSVQCTSTPVKHDLQDWSVSGSVPASTDAPLVKIEFKKAESDKSGSHLPEVSSASIESALEKWRVASSKRMVRLRRMIANKREEFARLKENVSNYEQKTDTMEAQLNSVRSTLSVETAKRLHAERELRELRVKFWELLAARQLQPWGPYNTKPSDKTDNTDAGYTGQVPPSPEEFTDPAIVSSSSSGTWKAQDGKKVPPGVVSFKKFLLPAVAAIAKTFQWADHKPIPPLSEVRREEPLPKLSEAEIASFVQSQQAFASSTGVFRPEDALITSPSDDAYMARPAFTSHRPGMPSADSSKPKGPSGCETNEHSFTPVSPRPVISKTVSDGCATVTVSITSGLGPAANITCSSDRFNLKSGKKIKSEPQTLAKSEIHCPTRSQGDELSTIRRRVKSAQVKFSDKDKATATGNLRDFIREKSPDQKIPLPKDLEKVKLLEELDQATDEWCPPCVECDVPVTEGPCLSPGAQATKMWSAPKLASERRSRYASYAAVAAGKYTRNDIGRQYSTAQTSDTQTTSDTTTTTTATATSTPAVATTTFPQPNHPLLDSFFSKYPTYTSLPDVITTAPKPHQFDNAPDIDLHQGQGSTSDLHSRPTNDLNQRLANDLHPRPTNDLHPRLASDLHPKPTNDLHPRSTPSDLQQRAASQEQCSATPTPTPPRAFHFDPLKMYSQSVNQQIRQGKCLTCGMKFSPNVDRYLVEEHIYFHHAFTE